MADRQGDDFDQGAASPAAAAVHAEIEAELRGLTLVQTIEARLSANPAYVAAMARQAEIPPTTTLPDYGSDAFWQQRAYVAADGSEITGLAAAVDHLTEVSRTLAWSEDGLPPGTIRRDREAVIVVGAPGVGKSSIANPLARSRDAAILDADEAKKLIPEYGRGEGANAVHVESGELAKQALRRLIREGDNLVLPKVGGNTASIDGLISSLKDAGYRVDVVEVVVPEAVAMDRMITRGDKTGRFIPAEVMADGIDGAPKTYQLLKAKGAADGYARIDNAPDRGQPRGILEDDSEILHAFGRRDARDRNAPAGGAARGPDQGRGDQESPDGLTSPRTAEVPAPAAAARVAAIVNRGDTVTNRLDGMTKAESAWLKSEFEAGRLARQSDPMLRNVVRYRRVSPDLDSRWQIAGEGQGVPSGTPPGTTPAATPDMPLSRPADATARPKRGLVERAGRFLNADTRAIDRVRSDLGEFAALDIDLPDGTRARAGDILDDLDSYRAADAFLQACGITQGGS